MDKKKSNMRIIMIILGIIIIIGIVVFFILKSNKPKDELKKQSDILSKQLQGDIQKNSNRIEELQGEVEVGYVLIIGTGIKKERVIVTNIIDNIPIISPKLKNSHNSGTTITIDTKPTGPIPEVPAPAATIPAATTPAATTPAATTPAATTPAATTPAATTPAATTPAATTPAATTPAATTPAATTPAALNADKCPSDYPFRTRLSEHSPNNYKYCYKTQECANGTSFNTFTGSNCNHGGDYTSHGAVSESECRQKCRKDNNCITYASKPNEWCVTYRTCVKQTGTQWGGIFKDKVPCGNSNMRTDQYTDLPSNWPPTEDYNYIEDYSRLPPGV